MSKYIFGLEDCEKWQRIKQEAREAGKRPKNPITGGHMPENGPLYREIDKQCEEMLKKMSKSRDSKRTLLPGGVFPASPKPAKKTSLSPKPIRVPKPSRPILKSLKTPKNSSRRVIFDGSLPTIEEIEEKENYMDGLEIHQLSPISTPTHMHFEEPLIREKEPIEKGCEYSDFTITEKRENSIIAEDSNTSIKVLYTKKSDILDNSAEVENSLYKEIFEFADAVTPNLVYYDQGFLCQEIKIGREYVSDESTIKRVLLFSEKMGEPLMDYIEELKSTDVFFLIFQVLYTLEYFNRINLRHNNLLVENIRVNTQPRRIVIYRLPDGTIIEQDTPYIFRIVNFENAAIYNKSVPRNFALDVKKCKTLGKCNQFDRTYDCYTFLSSLYSSLLRKHYDKMSNVISFIQDHIHIESPRDLLMILKENLSKQGLVRENPDAPDGFSLPEREKIKWGKIKFPIVENELLQNSDGIREEKRSSVQLKMTEILEVWNKECVKLEYDRENVFTRLYEGYLEDSQDIRSQDFDKVAKTVCSYLSYPMFYKFSSDQISEVLTRSEKKVFVDMVNLFKGEMPFLMPLL